MKRSIWVILLVVVAGINRAMAQIASFGFGTTSAVSGWTNVPGDPHAGAQTATAAGVTVSSISAANWVPNSVPSNLYDYGGASNATYFPQAVMTNTWLQWNGSSDNLALYNASVPQLQLSGLNPDSTYILRMSGSDTYYTGNTQYTVAGASVSGSQLLNIYNNTTQGVTFTGVRPDAGGHINIFVNATSTSSFAFISGLQVFSGTAVNVGTPVVALTAPVNGTVQSEGGNFILTATAAETGGSIAKVEFYADTTKIGEVDAAPYTMTWVDPDPGNYQVTAKATDAIGTIAVVSVNVGVESLNYFWSTTGNAATNGDSNFVGTVDSNRLSFRTKNVERMSISANGDIRLAGLASDSTPSRIVVADSTGKLYYQGVGSGGALSPGPGLGGTSTGIALGDSIPGPGPHSFTSSRYEYLNGNQFSFGGSVNDPVNKPVLRLYDNGDLSAGTTMAKFVSGFPQSGLRYYGQKGYLQLGNADLPDSVPTQGVSSLWYGYTPSGLIVNSRFPNQIHGWLTNSIYSGSQGVIDSGFVINSSFIGGEGTNFKGDTNFVNNSFVNGFSIFVNSTIAAPVRESFINGVNYNISKTVEADIIVGTADSTVDVSSSSLVVGSQNKFGGVYVVEGGSNLIDKISGTTVFGNANVDFSSALGQPAVMTAGAYPIFSLANSGIPNTHSQAVTVLYNGRTQINTTGFTNTLTQAQVTAAAALDVVSTNTGVLLPRLTTAQRNAILPIDLHNGLLLYNTDSSVFQYYNGSAWNSVGAGSAGAGAHWSFTSGATYDSLDNIGIGTSNTQGYKLAVNGSAIATRMVVKPQSAWPDYVFKQDYKLPGLDSLERYVRDQHHLPGMTSAGDVSKNGIDVGEQQGLLLQKLEEQSLYLIEENKRLMQLASRVANLDKEVRKLKRENAALKKNQKKNGH